MTKFSVAVRRPIAAITASDRRRRLPLAVEEVVAKSLAKAASTAPPSSTIPTAEPSGEQLSNAALTSPATPEAIPENWSPLLEQIQMQIAELENNRRRSLRELQQLAIKLSVAIARQVCLREIAEDDHRVESLIQTALQQFDPQGPLQIRVHPQTHDHLLHGLAARWDSNQIQLIADSRLGPADVQVHSPDHLLEARFEDQLQQIEQQLLESIANAEIERRQTGTDGPGLQRFPDRRQS